MRYIFFDIECANMFEGKAKICSFGYVITDKDYNILEKKDIVINPASPFDKYALKMMKTTLPYPKEVYDAAGKFNLHYDKIKALLTEKDQIVVGHGTINDAHFLLQECARYNLEPIDFDYTDTIKLYTKIENRDKHLDLHSIYEEVYPEDNSLCSHKSDDDAEMTMKIAKHLTAKIGRDLYDIVLNNNLLSDKVFLGRIIDSDGYLFKINPSGCRNAEAVLRRYLEEQVPSATGIFLGQQVSLKYKYPWLSLSSVMQMIKLVNMQGGLFFIGKNSADVIIQASVKNLPSNKPGSTRKNITLKDFYAMLHAEDDKEMTTIETREIVGNFPENKEWFNKYLETHDVKYSALDVLSGRVVSISLDFPVLKFDCFGEDLDSEGKVRFVKRKLIYDSATDQFSSKPRYDLKPGRDSYLSSAKFNEVDEIVASRLEQEKNTLFPNQIDKNIKVDRYNFVTAQKFLLALNGDKIEFLLKDSCLYEQLPHRSAVSVGQVENEIISTIQKYYSPIELTFAISKNNKFKFSYKHKLLPEFNPIKLEAKSSYTYELAYKYYEHFLESDIDKSEFPILIDKKKAVKYIPSLVSFKSDGFMYQIEIPCVIVQGIETQ